MKPSKLFISTIGFILLFVAASCENKTEESKAISSQPLRYFISYPNDTSNFIDQNKLKQGVWYTIKNGKITDTIVYKNDTPYPVTSSNVREVIDMLNKR